MTAVQNSATLRRQMSVSLLGREADKEHFQLNLVDVFGQYLIPRRHIGPMLVADCGLNANVEERQILHLARIVSIAIRR